MTDTAERPDLSDPVLYETTDPVPIWARLREESPLFWTEKGAAGSFWSVLDHELLTTVLTDPGTFVSERGMRLDGDPAAAVAAAGKMLIVTDPPRHGAIKRIINSAFTPRMVARLKDTMRTVVADVIDRALAEEAGEFVDIAARLPVAVICDILGVPREDWDRMLDLTTTAFGHSAATEEEATLAYTEIFLYYSDLVARRRREPGQDVVTALVHGEIDGVPLTDEEIFLNCTGIISGGNETTRHSTVGGLLAFVRNPDAWRALRERPELSARAAQEVLRYAASVLHVRRTAVRDVELAGHEIKAGDRLAMWLPSANRDPKVFPAPDAFDITRTPNRHVTLSHGTHYCLGGPLAAAEIEVTFEQLARRVTEIELAAEPQRLRSNLIWGYTSVPVTFRAA
ncbi:cytochrome P450 [Amycolatopsis sp.]|uniref:cytochrome P450 n=1 Tax=Amycolatopsis sp. TaxID=37632 RepID=UPI002D7E1D11|nr:cytochrome P450 [Amycolatopsis sp.]HET6709322.1 cytochrome P450 [Amycolatopsis sp.]